MGAKKEARDIKHVRQQLLDEQNRDPHFNCRKIESALRDENRRLRELLTEQASIPAELKKALGLIERLRAENIVLRSEKRLFFATIERCKHHIFISGNAAKKYAVALVKSQCEKARLI